MKKFITFFLVLILIFSFSGCGNSPNEVENIIDLTQSGAGPTADAVEIFYYDNTYNYMFGSIKSHYVIVYYKDGTEQNVEDALAEGKINISDLDRFGIKYYKDPIE